MAVESEALNICRVTGRFSCIPRHILTKKLPCKPQSVQTVTFHIINGIYLRLGAKIMENFRLLPVVVIQLNMKEPHITFAFARKFDLIFAHAQTLFSPFAPRCLSRPCYKSVKKVTRPVKIDFFFRADVSAVKNIAQGSFAEQ